ncbi:hypothetical protein NECID01_0617 [Nematocida sp. AWRm77]|nr:hypothetical protein NECID01_0617 [Nematocida sp. AWRm77]
MNITVQGDVEEKFKKPLDISKEKLEEMAKYDMDKLHIPNVWPGIWKERPIAVVCSLLIICIGLMVIGKIISVIVQKYTNSRKSVSDEEILMRSQEDSNTPPVYTKKYNIGKFIERILFLGGIIIFVGGSIAMLVYLYITHEEALTAIRKDLVQLRIDGYKLPTEVGGRFRRSADANSSTFIPDPTKTTIILLDNYSTHLKQHQIVPYPLSIMSYNLRQKPYVTLDKLIGESGHIRMLTVLSKLENKERAKQLLQHIEKMLRDTNSPEDVSKYYGMLDSLHYTAQ